MVSYSQSLSHSRPYLGQTLRFPADLKMSQIEMSLVKCLKLKCLQRRVSN